MGAALLAWGWDDRDQRIAELPRSGHSGCSTLALPSRLWALKFWHLLVVGALAVSAVAATVHIGQGATNETKTVASVATTMPAEIAKQAAAANVRSAIPSLEAFYADHGTYGGADVSALRRDYDPGIDPSVKLGWVETRPLLPGEHGRGPDGERDQAQRRDRARRLLNGVTVFFAGRV